MADVKPAFTRADVNLVRDEATMRGFMAMDDDENPVDRKKQAALNDLADRIEKMLGWFTRGDVRNHREEAQALRDRQLDEHRALWHDSMADRIEALLPPEEA